MADENFTLATFYTSWKEYQDHLQAAIASLTTGQLALRAAPEMRSVGENALHIIGCRTSWFTEFLGEQANEALAAYASWNEMALGSGASIPPAAELAEALGHTWQFMMDCVARWSPTDMQRTFPDEWDGKKVELSRAWVVWHVLEHDLHHGGEVSLTLGMRGVPAQFPG